MIYYRSLALVRILLFLTTNLGTQVLFSILIIANNDKKSEFFKLATEMKRQYPNDHPVQTIFVVGLY